MREEEAKAILEARVEAGVSLQPAGRGSLPAIKELQEMCLGAGIPALMGPCSGGG